MTGRHFTAVVKIIEVTPATTVTKGQYRDTVTETVPKTEKDVANIVLRDADAEALVSDVIEHLELVQTRVASKKVRGEAVA